MPATSVLDALRHQSPRDLVAAPSRSGVLKRHLKHASIVTDSAFIPLHIFDTHRSFEYAGARQFARPLNRGREFPGLAQARKILFVPGVTNEVSAWSINDQLSPSSALASTRTSSWLEMVATVPAPSAHVSASRHDSVPGCSEP